MTKVYLSNVCPSPYRNCPFLDNGFLLNMTKMALMRKRGHFLLLARHLLYICTSNKRV